MSNDSKIHIDVLLVQHLVSTQFPQWAHLPIKPVEPGGWDNKTFHLGEHMSIRLPSAVQYASKVEKEHYWLPKLAPLLPLPIPTPLAIGKPTKEYPLPWSIYKWIDGQNASLNTITDLSQFAIDLGKFLVALQHIPSTEGPVAGPHNFYRGGSLKTYDAETQLAIKKLENQIDTNTVKKIWDIALSSEWHNPPVWIHGDIAPTNLLVKNGQLNAVIDFGGLGIGDPACDLAIAWTFFTKESRAVFRTTLDLDNATWERGRGWALWKALIIYAQLPGTNPLEIKKSKQIIDEILTDYSFRSP
jgi:aminoglycoside phosphotransferase (APT) family kinase protein